MLYGVRGGSAIPSPEETYLTSAGGALICITTKEHSVILNKMAAGPGFCANVWKQYSCNDLDLVKGMQN